MKKLFYWLWTSIFLFTSCISIPSTTSYTVLPMKKMDYGIVLLDVNITNESIKDKELSSQVSEIVYAMLNRELDMTKYEQRANLSILINQRSYYKGINQYNSIFLNYKLVDENDNVILNNCYFDKITDSIESSKIQYKLVSKIVNDVKLFLENSKK